MVKLTTFTRTDKDFERETKMDLHKVHRSYSPSAHPLQQAREYQRAVVASKISKIFAKPFIAALSGHSDGISCMQKSRTNPTSLISGSFDGEVLLWDLSLQRVIGKADCFESSVKGLCISDDSKFLIATGDERNINLYLLKALRDAGLSSRVSPAEKFISSGIVTGIDLLYQSSNFLTCGEGVELWDLEKSQPIERFDWGSDTITKVKANPVERHIILCSSMDRGLFLHDTRARTNLAKTYLMNKSSSLAWNPMEPFNFVAGNEDGNAYSFDMRNMTSARKIHKDHIGAM
jgi:WD repeat and SOF domain-containing protein 1